MWVLLRKAGLGTTTCASSVAGCWGSAPCGSRAVPSSSAIGAGVLGPSCWSCRAAGRAAGDAAGGVGFLVGNAWLLVGVDRPALR